MQPRAGRPKSALPRPTGRLRRLLDSPEVTALFASQEATDPHDLTLCTPVQRPQSAPVCRRRPNSPRSSSDAPPGLLDFSVNSWLSKHGHREAVQACTSSIKMLRAWFKFLKQPGRDRVGVHELEEPLTSVGLAASRDDVVSLVAAADRDGVGSLDFSQFLALMSTHHLPAVPAVHVLDLHPDLPQPAPPPRRPSVKPRRPSTRVRPGTAARRGSSLGGTARPGSSLGAARRSSLVLLMTGTPIKPVATVTTASSTTASSTTKGSTASPRPRAPQGAKPPRSMSVMAGRCRVWQGSRPSTARPASRSTAAAGHSDTAGSDPPTRANSPVTDDPQAPVVATRRSSARPPSRSTAGRRRPSTAPDPTTASRLRHRRKWSMERRAGQALVIAARAKQERIRAKQVYAKPEVVDSAGGNPAVALFHLFRTGALGNTCLPFPLLVTAYRRRMLMQACMSDLNSEDRAAGLRVLQAVKRTASMSLWGEACGWEEDHQRAESCQQSTVPPTPAANAWQPCLSVASKPEFLPGEFAAGMPAPHRGRGRHRAQSVFAASPRKFSAIPEDASVGGWGSPEPEASAPGFINFHTGASNRRFTVATVQSPRAAAAR